jgi:hypothetical protein
MSTNNPDPYTDPYYLLPAIIAGATIVYRGALWLLVIALVLAGLRFVLSY